MLILFLFKIGDAETTTSNEKLLHLLRKLSIGITYNLHEIPTYA